MAFTRTPETVAKRAQQALDAAQNIAAHNTGARSVVWRLEDIRIVTNAHGDIYASESEPASGVVALGDWNEVSQWSSEQNTRIPTPCGDLPERLCKVFESLGIECLWTDGYDFCSDCGKIIRTEPDSHSFTPYYHEIDNGLVCFNCEPEHKYPDTYRWLSDHGACRDGKNFVGKDRTLAEAVMDDNASNSHLQWLWDELGMDDVHVFTRTRELLRDACIEKGI